MMFSLYFPGIQPLRPISQEDLDSDIQPPRVRRGCVVEMAIELYQLPYGK